MTRALLSRLRADARGVTVVEFAIVCPVLVTLMMGLCDLTYQAYVQSVLDGAVIKAGRDAALEGYKTDQTALDKKVQGMVGMLGPNMKFVSTRANYPSFSQISKPETFTDKNANGKLDTGECFTDINANNTWDSDPSRTGQGGANDVTKYSMKVTYTRLFPVSGLLGWGTTQSLTSATILKNQPYKTQTTTSTQVCLK